MEAANGNTLVHFGTSRQIGGALSGGPIETFEITASGTVAWRLRIDNANTAYRANPYNDIAGESVIDNPLPPQ